MFVPVYPIMFLGSVFVYKVFPRSRYRHQWIPTVEGTSFSLLTISFRLSGSYVSSSLGIGIPLETSIIIIFIWEPTSKFYDYSVQYMHDGKCHYDVRLGYLVGVLRIVVRTGKHLLVHSESIFFKGVTISRDRVRGRWSGLDRQFSYEDETLFEKTDENET